jgi:hypothetical protein
MSELIFKPATCWKQRQNSSSIKIVIMLIDRPLLTAGGVNIKT